MTCLALVAFPTWAKENRFNGEYKRMNLQGEVRDVEYLRDGKILHLARFRDVTNSERAQSLLNYLCPEYIKISSRPAKSKYDHAVIKVKNSDNLEADLHDLGDKNFSSRTPLIIRAVTLNGVLLNGLAMTSSATKVSKLEEGGATVTRTSLSKQKNGDLLLKHSKENTGLINSLVEYQAEEHEASCRYQKL